jgi:hypothetical protein
MDENIIKNAQDYVEKLNKVYKRSQLYTKNKSIDSSIVDTYARAIVSWKWSEATKILNEQVKIFNKDKSNGALIMRLMIILGLSFTKKRLSNKIFKTFYK